MESLLRNLYAMSNFIIDNPSKNVSTSMNVWLTMAIVLVILDASIQLAPFIAENVILVMRAISVLDAGLLLVQQIE